MSENIIIDNKKFKIYLTESQIDKTVIRLSDKINQDYLDKEIYFLVVLKGAFIFAADLVRKLRMPCFVDFCNARSYGKQLFSSGKVSIKLNVDLIKNKNVIIIEDIVDSGLTLSELVKQIKAHEPESLEIACLLSKPDLRKININVKYIGLEIPPNFIVGYGLDYAEQGRELPAIYGLEE